MNDEERRAAAGHAFATGPKVLAAVAKATGEMKRLAKDNKNAEQKYDFASVDDFLAMTGPVCATNGLVTLMDEVSVDLFEKQGKYGVTHWVKYLFAITTFHKSGEAMPTVRRSVEVIRSGAQAAGSAQSYALKQYLRALFQIPTGDKDDPDHGAIEQEPKQQGNPRQQRQEHIDHPRGEAPADIAIKSLNNADTLEQLQAIWAYIPRGLQALPEVSGAKEQRKKELQPKNNADLGGDKIPY